ncbi:MAG: hypothetical protein R6U28_07505 [Cyclonatronaceae bacterium]
MLQTILIPLNLKEPADKLNNLAVFISHFGTESACLLHVYSGSEDERARRKSALKDKGCYFVTVDCRFRRKSVRAP